MSKPLTKQDGTDSIIEIPGYGVTMAAGNTVPADATAGYSKGCIYQHLDASTAATTIYVNTGTVSSATFRALYPFAQGAALTAADASTVDGTYGAQEQAVIENLRTRLGEVEARLEAAGIVAAN
jgi:hypothetical protein